MKFRVKTLDSRNFSVELSDLRTVGELKRRICRMRGAWLHPENQRLLYAGRELKDKKLLRSYSIDERIFLLMLPRKTNSQKLKKISSSTSTSTLKSSKTGCAKKEFSLLPPCLPTAVIKNYIIKMGGWKENDVRQALLLSLNNPKRAIDYLTCKKAPFEKMVPPPPSNLFLVKSHAEKQRSVSKKPKNTRDIASLFVHFPSVEKLTCKECTTTTAAPRSRALKPNPAALVLENIHDIERLVHFGFSHDDVLDAYIACEGNVRRAAVLLYEEYFGKRLH